MMMIFFRRVLSLLVFGVIFATAPLNAQSVYTISGIEVDATGDTPQAAQLKAFQEAKRLGSYQLIERLTLPEDRRKAGRIIVSNADANRLARAVQVEQERRGAGRYIGRLSIVYNGHLVRQFLEQKRIAYVDRKAEKALLVPIATTGAEASIFDWRSSWQEAQSRASLTPFIVASDVYYEDSPVSDMMREARASGASRILLSALSPTGSSRTIEILADGTRNRVSSSNQLDMTANINETLAALERGWKRANVVRMGTATTLLKANARYRSLTDWHKIRQNITASPLIEDMQVKAVAVEGAMLSLKIRGDVTQLQQALRRSGLSLTEGDFGWEVRTLR